MLKVLQQELGETVGHLPGIVCQCADRENLGQVEIKNADLVGPCRFIARSAYNEVIADYCAVRDVP